MSTTTTLTDGRLRATLTTRNASRALSRAKCVECEMRLDDGVGRLLRRLAVVVCAWALLTGGRSVVMLAVATAVTALAFGRTTRTCAVMVAPEIGVEARWVDWFGRETRARAFAPAEDVAAFSTRECVTTTDVFYQLICERKNGLDPVVLFAEFRCSAAWMRVVYRTFVKAWSRE